MRVVAVVLLLAVLAVGGLFIFGLLPKGSPPDPTEELFQAAASGEPEGVRAALADGAAVDFRNAEGFTPLMVAVSEGAEPALLGLLLQAGADVNASTAAGATPLSLAASSGTPAQVLYLMNAGADPSVEGEGGASPAELARANPQVRASGVYARLEEFTSATFTRGWPSGYLLPVEGATISSRRSHLPGAPRAYRNGTHEGFDFYSGTVSVAIAYGTPINAVASGTVIRADHDYVEHTLDEYNELIEVSSRALDTPPEVLDGLRGRQVWIEHPGGFVSRYAHLAAVAESVREGTAVKQGDIIGTTGNSGTIEAAEGTQDDPHPHVEIWRGDVYLGAGLEPEETWALAGQLFGRAALPPYHD